MIRWSLFVGINLLSVVACLVFVPRAHLERYAACKKNAFCRAAELLMHGIWIVAGLQCVLLSVPLSVKAPVIGCALLLAGRALVIWAYRVNPWFVPALNYVPPYLLVKTGPYRWMRHPGYLGFALSAIGSGLCLGQPWALWPMIAYLFLILCRIRQENRLLYRSQMNPV